MPSASNKAIALFFLLSCAVAHAQDKGDGASQSPAINPGRPTVTDPAPLTAPGYLEIEVGGQDARGGEGTQRQFSVPTVLKLTNKAGRLELHVALDSFVTQKDDQGEHLSGFGDVTPGLQYLATKQGPHSYDLAARIETKIPTAARGVGSGKTDYDLLLLASKDYNSTLHADYNVAVYQLGKADGTGYATQYQISGSLNTKLSPALTLEDELYGFSGNSEGGTITSTLHALAYQTSHTIAFDVGVDIGLSHAAPKRTYLFGTTFFAGRLF